MFIELVDALRCIEPHPESQLVAAQTTMKDRHMIHGVLGCPRCRAEYPVIDGVAHFGEAVCEGLGEPLIEVTEYEALRCAALLDLQGPSGFVLLCGEWGRLAPLLADVAAVHIVLLNPPAHFAIPEGNSAIRHGAKLPFMRGLARGAALDAAATASIPADAFAAAVRAGGRIAAPLQTPLPADAHMLASDERHWVAEVSHPTLATISVRRAAR